MKLLLAKGVALAATFSLAAVALAAPNPVDDPHPAPSPTGTASAIVSPTITPTASAEASTAGANKDTLSPTATPSVTATPSIAATATVTPTPTSTVDTGDGPTSLQFDNPTGTGSTFSTNGSIDLHGMFFQSLGTNGRMCGSCHVASDGWSITPPHLQARFDATQGLDPIFHNNDGTNSPTADQSTVAARRAASSMLLSKGLIRVGLPIPPNAEFTLEAVDDPYGHASAQDLSLFRRPLPATNLRFLTTVMWDGRESPAGRSLQDDLTSQALDATRGHAQSSVDPSASQLQQIVSFELGLFTAQLKDNAAGELQAAGATGGARALSQQNFFVGINNIDGNGLPPNPAFTLFDAWAKFRGEDSLSAARQSVARGQAIFNDHPISISGVAGLNDALDKPVITGHCSTCHDAPNVGDHSVPGPLNIGTSDASRRTPDQPLYTLRCTATGQVIQTTDPGRALISGRCEDIGKVKGPILRGLAARAPYFHNGSAASLDDVVSFYNSRFNIGFSAQDQADLVAFLRSL